ncbi:ABC transporter transmembrane domain-containing protein [Actinoplanes rectilineatus]|uniref:ABC transporter transmembrane domain-containing protein n=1 Tax=Actinoplanes rectilineatus TaxID=113571 RepID=UPI0005F27A3E|nr:ABC transporter ATP-binding protein [Actinoplanes rectilineatus]
MSLDAGGVLRRTIRDQRGRVAAGVAFLCLHQASEAMVPVAIGLTIDRAVATSDTGALLIALAGLALLFTVLAFAWRIGARFGVVAVEHETHRMRLEIAGRALDPRGQRSGMRDGELLSVTASDTEHAALVVQASSMILAACTALIVSAIALLVVDPVLGGGVLLGVPLVLLGLQRLGPLITRRGEAQQEALASATATAVDLVAGLRVLRGLGAQDHAARRYAAASSAALAGTLHAARAKGMQQGVTTAINGLLLAVIAGVAGWFAIQGRITIGELVAVVGLAQFVAEPVQALGWCLQLLATAKASAARVARVLGAAPLVGSGSAAAPPAAPERLVLSGIGHGGLDGLSLRVAAGEVVGIMVYEPKHAESLVAVLAGTVPREDYRGEIRVDGVPVEELDLAAARGVVLVEPHDVTLFEGTLRDNIAAGVPDERIDAAVRAAAADDIVASQPDGLDQVLTERGANLSGGQRQRVALARALAAASPVLVLHDPATAVDAVTESLIAERLVAARAGESRATVVVTSSPALLGVADRVAVLDDGRIVAEGAHEELAASDPRYREAVLR